MPQSRMLALALTALCLACARNGNPQSDGSTPALLASVQATTSGDSVHFVLQVTNTTDAPIALNFNSGQSFDFVVAQEGRPVWRWSEEMMFTQALRSEALAPGETRTYDATWTPATQQRGEFTVTGILTARDHRVEQATRFRLP